MKKVVHAACPHDCPDACGVLITVEDGRATQIQGDPAHPVTRGFLCAKVAKYLDRVYSPDRVLYPMRRVRPKGPVAGEGARATQAFERISWDGALDEITSRFRQIASDFGSEAILPYSYGGTLGALNGASMDRRFFHRLGASQLARNICSAAGEAGLKSVIGIKMGTEPEQFTHSRYIIAWGANIHGNNVHLWPFIAEARRKGAKLVVIDPYRTRTAACADWYLPINPGTDAALALGMMHVIINDGLHDADYLARYTVGFDQLREKVREYPPERVAQWTGIAAADIVKLAREYATTRPAVIRMNYGVQRSEGGGMATRAIAMLPCVTGSWKEVGGGLQLSTSGAYGLNREALERPDLMQKALGGRTHCQHGGTGYGAQHAGGSADQSALRLQLESGGGLSQPQPGHPRIAASRLVHSRARAVLHRHHRLRRHRSAGDHVLRAQRPADRLRALLSADVGPGHRAPGRMPLQRRTVSRPGRAHGI